MRFCSLGQGKRTQELHNRVEPVVLACCNDVLLVTSYGQHLAEPACKCAHNLVIKIPGPDIEGLCAVYCFPRGRSLEIGQVKQAFIHHCKGVSHRLAGFFGNGDREFLLRSHGVSYLDYRLKVRIRVLYHKALYSVQPQWQVVAIILVWLYQGYLDIEVRRHFRCHGEGVRGILAGFGGNPLPAYYAGTVFYAYKRLSAYSGGDVYRCLFTCTVGLLVRGERKH